MAGSLIIRGGGDLATGVCLRLFRAGLRPIITELAQPLVVRRTAAFAEAMYEGVWQVEGVTGRRVGSLEQALEVCQEANEVPVLLDPQAQAIRALARRCELEDARLAVIDGRMRKLPPEEDQLIGGVFLVGLGPGFQAPHNCQAVVETNRGPNLGRVIWQGSGEPDTGLPERVAGYQAERVLRAPVEGCIRTLAEIGQHVQTGQVVAEVNGRPVLAAFPGVLRGLLRDGLPVQAGLKIGDVDPRNDPQACYQVSDKALAIGGAVLEALLAAQVYRLV